VSDTEPRDFHDAETVSNRFSLVWLVPLIALFLTLGVAWKAQSDRGPLIEIVLKSATGVEEGKTVIKRSDVQIGVVEDVDFTEDGSNVVVSARIEKEFAGFIDDDARFWVVSPQVSLEGISGLETVLSGSYIEASWDRAVGEPKSRFTALENPPLTPPDAPGKRVRLIAEDGGSMSVGAPVFYKRIEVGRIESKELTADGEAVVFDLFIEAPHDRRLTEGTRFWNTSGISVELGTQGAKLKLESFSSFLRGGIAFGTVALGGAPVEEYHLYRLFAGEQTARASIFDDDYGAQIRLSIEFEGSIRGLDVGAPVELRGYRVGEVIDVLADVDDRAGVPSVSLVVTILLQPSRLGLPKGEAEESLAFLKTLVRNGMRAKLASASLISSSLYIELVDRPGEAEREIDETARPYPRLPSVASDLDDLAASAEGVLTRINALPIEELLDAATELLGNVNTIVASEDTRAIPGGVNGLLAEARTLVGDPALAAATGDLAATIAAARAVVESVSEAELVTSLQTALEAATGTADSIRVAADGTPPLIANLSRLSGNVADLPLDALILAATTLMVDADALVASDEAKAIPADLAASVADIRAILGDLREADTAATLAAALTEAGAAAASIREAAESAPELVANLTAFSATARDLPLGDLVTSASNAVRTVDTLVASESVKALPDDLSAALGDVRALLADLRSADAAVNLATALAEAGEAAKSIRVAADGAPALMANLASLGETANALPLDDLVEAATTLVRNADAVIGSESVAALPDGIAATMEDIRAILTDLRDADAAANLATALAEAGEAAKSIRAAADSAPTLMANLADLSETANALPLDDLITSATALLRNADAIVGSEEIARLPEDVSAALADVRILLNDLTEAEAAKSLADALARAGDAAVSIDTAAKGAPELIDRLTVAAANVADLPLDQLVAGAETLVLDTGALVRSDELRAVPTSITTTLANIDAVLAELRQAEIAARLAAALDAATTTAGGITTAVQGVPAVLTQIEALAAQIRTLPVDETLARANALIASMDRILSAPGADQLPESITAAFDQIRVTIADLQRRDVPANFNDSIVSFNDASVAFTALSANINTVLPQVSALAARADSVLSEFDVGSELNYEAITTIREIRDAARAITALVATIERRPNSLLLGK